MTISPQLGSELIAELKQAGAVFDFARVQELVRDGACMHTTDDEGRTPLMLAILYRHAECVALFISNFADVQARDHAGADAMTHAQQWVADVEDSLFKFGNNPNDDALLEKASAVIDTLKDAPRLQAIAIREAFVRDARAFAERAAVVQENTDVTAPRLNIPKCAKKPSV